MSTVITDNRHYSDIADAIRAKGISGTFMPAQMAAAIAVIPSGGGGVVTGTFTVPAPYSIGLTVNHNANIIGDYLFVFWMQQESFEELKLDTSNTKNYVIGAICNCTNSFYDFAENNAAKFNKQGLRWNYTPSSNTHTMGASATMPVSSYTPNTIVSPANFGYQKGTYDFWAIPLN